MTTVLDHGPQVPASHPRPARLRPSGVALALILGPLAIGPAQAQTRAEAQILVPRGGAGGYAAVPLPGTRPGDRVEFGRDVIGTPETGQTTGLYGPSGERLGTLRTTPGGGTGVYGKDGRRLN